MLFIPFVRLFLELLIYFLKFVLDTMVLSNVGSVTGCLTTTPSVDPFFGTLELERDIYCSKAAGMQLPGFIDGLTCCYPMSTDEFRFKMYLYLPGESSYQEIAFNDTDVREKLTSFPKVVYVFHGYIEIPLFMAYIRLIREYWNEKNAAVIVADYSFGNQIDYFQGVANIRTAGMAIGYSVVNWNIAGKTLMVGLSLGGQLIGQAALYVNQHSNKKISECHALDPAGPSFNGAPDKAKLDRSDCDVVQVIHMTGPLNEPLVMVEARVAGSYGTDEKSGHCDFWVDCGYNQYESCTKSAVSGVKNAELSAIQLGATPSCGHSRAPVIYINELYGKCNFTTQPCADCGNKNLKCSRTEVGKINGFPPNSYCTPDMDANFVLFTSEDGNKCSSYIQGDVLNPIGS